MSRRGDSAISAQFSDIESDGDMTLKKQSSVVNGLIDFFVGSPASFENVCGKRIVG